MQSNYPPNNYPPNSTPSYGSQQPPNSMPPYGSQQQPNFGSQAAPSIGFNLGPSGSYNQPPSGYNQPMGPPPSSGSFGYNQPPGSGYNQPPVPGYQPPRPGYNQPPGSGYNQPPGPGYNQPGGQNQAFNNVNPYVNKYGGGGSQPNQPYNNQNQPQWNERAYFNEMFTSLDYNRTGRISYNELHEALRRGQPNAQFDQTTVKILLDRYDRNRDQQIEIDEFYQLFTYLNEQYNIFLDIDTDSSGSVDGRELENSMRKRGFQFSSDFYNYVVNEISRRVGRPGITFDLYVRVLARADFLRDQYQRSNQQVDNMQMEYYFRQNFFINF